MPPADPSFGRRFLVALGSFALAAGLAGQLRRLGVPLWVGVVLWAAVMVVVGVAAVWFDRRRAGRS